MDNQTDFPIYLFHKGENYEAYKLMCPSKDDCGSGYIFRVWAPKAKSISVVGDFNNWDSSISPMKKISVGLWECNVENAKMYDNYKFAVVQSNGKTVLKSDPYALHTETSPGNASKVYDIEGFSWSDSSWLIAREMLDHKKLPMNIYELNIASWRRFENGNFYSYRKLAEELIPYVKSMNYTHIELMPISEFPYDGSWGYQVTGMFAPTSRFGTPHDFMHFINECHKANIFVIIDWVPAHFPKDENGLYMFDGKPLYEYADKTKQEHKEWGTMVYDYGRNEVKSFLISSAMFWLEKYHIDGIRVDAVASMLYLNYNRDKGNWLPNAEGGEINLEAKKFFQILNSNLLTKHKGAIMIAEESTAFPLITMPIDVGGLGFNYKWNMGWMNDTLEYIKLDPFCRKDKHSNMTFGMDYAYTENFILPLSHDEVVHGKLSLINRMPGKYEDKFRAYMTYLGFMMAHPGKKLLFMGGEFGQFIEWDYQKQLDWLLLQYPMHRSMQKFVKDINKFYLTNSALFELDHEKDGFEWICGDDNRNNIISFIRYDSKGDFIVVVCNFSPVTRTNYEIGVPQRGKYRAVFNNDVYFKRGSGSKVYTAKPKSLHNQPNSIEIVVNANSFAYIKRIIT